MWWSRQQAVAHSAPEVIIEVREPSSAPAYVASEWVFDYLVVKGAGMVWVWSTATGEFKGSLEGVSYATPTWLLRGVGSPWRLGFSYEEMEIIELSTLRTARTIKLREDSSSPSRFPYPLREEPSNLGVEALSSGGERIVLSRTQMKWEEVDPSRVGRIGGIDIHIGGMGRQPYKVIRTEKWIKVRSLVQLWTASGYGGNRSFLDLEWIKLDSSDPIVDVSGDGSYVLQQESQLLRLVDARTGKVSAKFSLKGAEIKCTAFSAKGDLLAVGASDNNAYVWDIARRKWVRTFKGHSGAVVAVTFSPSNRYLLTGSTDGTARLWDVQRGQQLYVYSGHRGKVTSLAFSADERSVWTGGEDGAVCAWSANTGQLLCTIRCWSNGQWAIFTPEGYYDSSNDGRVQGLVATTREGKVLNPEEMRQRCYRSGLLAQVLRKG